ncbi:MAG TPA: sensor histidine kinase [Candidatus Limnocylindrales bacterium]|nr:sensor histidine kinase [Candidatus Limnocylindrales bacterium]
MQAHVGRTALVAAAGLVLVIWSTFGPFLVSAGPYHWSVTLTNASINLGFGLLWVAVLAVAVHRDPGGRMWKLLLLYLAAQGHWVLGYVQTDWTWTASQLFGPLPAAILLHLVLGFPDGRLRDRFDRWLVGLVYVIAVPLQVLGFLVWDPAWVGCGPTDWCPANVLLVVRNDDLYFLVGRVGLLSPVLALLAIAETIRHWRQAAPAARRALAPVALGMPLVFLQLGIWFLAPALDRDDIRVFILENKVFDLPSYLTPSLFLIGVVRSRLARGAIADLAVELGRGVPLGGLRAALTRTLRDPTLELAFAAPDGAGLVDPDGRPFVVGDAPGRAVTRLEREGELLAVVVHDAALERDDAALLRAAASVAGLALENERLQAQVRAQLEEVRASRQRIVEAGDAERRRVERDLHDGAQQRLVALAMRLDAARGTTIEAQALIDAATAELGVAIGEVRRLARGLHPTILSERGLRAAIEALAERTPIPVEVEADAARYPATVEATAYFVVAEALTNVARYAEASHAAVRLAADHRDLTVEVRDDGRGGADPGRGTGLRGLSDRVAAIGGTLQVDSPSGGGTVLRARLPLEAAAS